ncbi:unnamed protein product, partial [marine sediment metagenome]
INFNGKQITVRSEDPDDAGVVAATIIDGGGSSRCVKMDSGETLDSIIEGFTLQNGFGQGSGVQVVGSSATIRKNVITSCSGGFYGALHITGAGASAVITDNTVTGNSASGAGGGIAALSGATSVTITGNVISGNSANSAGGIWLQEVTATLENNLIYENTSVVNGGGGLFIWSDTVTLANCTVADNTAATDGGGLYLRSATTVTLNNCILWGNSAAGNGNQAYVKHSDCTLNVNYSDVQGAQSGIYS